MAYALGVLLFILALLVSIALHEGGHMIVARWLKMKVPRYSVGFGPTIFSRKSGETEYSLRAVPAGGFVEILPADEDDPHVNHALTDSSNGKSEYSEERLKVDRDFRKSMLSHVAPWKRILVFLAGPAVNIVLGTLLLIGAFWMTPIMTPQPTIDVVNSCDSGLPCAASEAGFRNSDKIIAVNGEPTSDTVAISEAITPGESATLTVVRDGENHDLTVEADENGHIGINFSVIETPRTLPQAVVHTGEVFMSSLEVIAELPERFMNTASILTGQDRPEDSLGSVVSAGNTFGTTTSSSLLEPDLKAKTLLAYTGAFNLSIGFINLLPLMPLDGGRIAIAIADSIRNASRRARKLKPVPMNTKFVQVLSAATVAIVFGGFAVIVLADIISPAGV